MTTKQRRFDSRLFNFMVEMVLCVLFLKEIVLSLLLRPLINFIVKPDPKVGPTPALRAGAQGLKGPVGPVSWGPVGPR